MNDDQQRRAEAAARNVVPTGSDRLKIDLLLGRL